MRALKSAKLSEAMSETVARRLDSARNAISAQTAALEQSKDWTLPRSATARDIALDGEVRATLRAMAPEARLAALNAAIASNDAPVLSAAFSGPSLLIAMPADQRNALVDNWRKRHSPNWARHEQLKSAAAKVEQAGSASIAWLGELNAQTGLEQLVTKAAEARAKAEAAIKAA